MFSYSSSFCLSYYCLIRVIYYTNLITQVKSFSWKIFQQHHRANQSDKSLFLFYADSIELFAPYQVKRFERVVTLLDFWWELPVKIDMKELKLLRLFVPQWDLNSHRQILWSDILPLNYIWKPRLVPALIKHRITICRFTDKLFLKEHWRYWSNYQVTSIRKSGKFFIEILPRLLSTWTIIRSSTTFTSRCFPRKLESVPVSKFRWFLN